MWLPHGRIYCQMMNMLHYHASAPYWCSIASVFRSFDAGRVRWEVHELMALAAGRFADDATAARAPCCSHLPD